MEVLTTMTTDSPILSYGFPSNRFRPSRFALDFAAVFATFMSLCWVIGFVLIFVLPKVRDIYRDFKIAIPAAARMVLGFSSWYANDWGWLITFPVPLALALFLAWRSNAIEPPRHRW